MLAPVIHYFYDPLCGWCYAAEPMLERVASHANGRYTIRLHGGGAFDRLQLSAHQRDCMRDSDQRIMALTGQLFDSGYFERLATRCNLYDSAPPIAAMLAAQAIEPWFGPLMLSALQHAHYRQGHDICESVVQCHAAEAIGLDGEMFRHELAYQSGERTYRHIRETRKLMAEIEATSFPTFALQVGTRMVRLPHDRFYGNPEGFPDEVDELLRSAESCALCE